MVMASWKDLSLDLLGRIVDCLDFKSYMSVRGTCLAWRRALAPLNPTVLVISNEHRRFSFRSSTSDITGMPFRSTRTLFYNNSSCCVGSSNGWIIVAVRRPGHERLIPTVFVLLNPITAEEIVLPPLIVKGIWVWNASKVVIAPNPSKDKFTAAAICGATKIAYVTAGATRWAVREPTSFSQADYFTDLVYHDPGLVYCLTDCGDVYVLRVAEPPPAEASTVQQGSSGTSQQQELSSAVDTIPAPILVWHFSNYLSRISLSDVSDMFRRYHAELRLSRSAASEQGPDLNAPATLAPLLSRRRFRSFRFHPENAFAQPYVAISRLITVNYLVVCESNLYQVWKYTSCPVTLHLPKGGKHRMTENDTFVLRYYPERQPCWDAVKDLGGCSFFVGKNNAVSLRAESLLWFRANCVYWSDEDQGMVFDVETGKTAPCKSSPLVRHSNSTILWYFLQDMNNAGGQQQ